MIVGSSRTMDAGVFRSGAGECFTPCMRSETRYKHWFSFHVRSQMLPQFTFLIISVLKHLSSMMVRTMIALLCIMLVSLTIVIACGTYAVVENQYQASVAQEEASIESLARVLDQSFYDYVSLASKITTIQELRPYWLLEENPVAQIKAKELLQDLKGANRRIIDICLYDYNQDFFVTSIASYQPDSFIQSYYSFGGIDRTEVYHLFCTSRTLSNPLYLPVGTVNTSENDTAISDALLFLTPLPQRSNRALEPQLSSTPPQDSVSAPPSARSVTLLPAGMFSERSPAQR